MLKKLPFMILVATLLPCSAYARNWSAYQTLNHAYPSIKEACIVDTDADTGEHNRIAVAENRRHVVYCVAASDGMTGVTCRCRLGDSSVDASSGVTSGVHIFAGAPKTLNQLDGDTHLSCVPAADDTEVHACPVN